jgi:hypothetical protein
MSAAAMSEVNLFFEGDTDIHFIVFGREATE